MAVRPYLAPRVDPSHDMPVLPASTKRSTARVGHVSRVAARVVVRRTEWRKCGQIHPVCVPIYWKLTINRYHRDRSLSVWQSYRIRGIVY